MKEDSVRGDLYRKEGGLFLDGCSLAEAAEKYGTPLYIYSARRISENYTAYREAFDFSDTTVCYAVKSNYNADIISRLASMGAGADIVSGGELFMALRAGIDPENIVFSGVGKTDDEIKEAVRVKVRMLNIESSQELESVGRIAAAEGIKAGISFRINPDIDPLSHPKISTGLRESKFGIPADRALELYQAAAGMDSVEVKGVHLHIGSQITDLEPFRLAASAALDFASGLSRRGINIKYVDIGGGLGINYGNTKVPSPADVAGVVREYFENTPYSLIIEPGRSLVGNAGYLLTKILYVKKESGKNFVIVDAGFNDLLRPAMYGSYHEIIPVSGEGERFTADIAGPVCETGDVIASGREIFGVKIGNCLAVCDAGAYGFSMSSNYNSRPRPAELMADEGKLRLIRRRERYEDLIQTEL